MKYEIHRELTIITTLDNSEAIMFTKGGKHEVILEPDQVDDLQNFNQVKISVQIERNKMGMFDHTYGEAQRHREYSDKINVPPAKQL